MLFRVAQILIRLVVAAMDYTKLSKYVNYAYGLCDI